MQNRKTIRNLVLTTVGMFCFAFLLVPIYDVFCEITGLNGKISGPSSEVEKNFSLDKKREILVQFITHNND